VQHLGAVSKDTARFATCGGCSRLHSGLLLLLLLLSILDGSDWDAAACCWQGMCCSKPAHGQTLLLHVATAATTHAHCSVSAAVTVCQSVGLCSDQMTTGALCCCVCLVWAEVVIVLVPLLLPIGGAGAAPTTPSSMNA
jgi:hypothetical protein